MGRFVPKDTFFKKAKQEGYRARSAYKLKEALDKFHLIKKGDAVLDVGCAPGGFLQVISDIVGGEGIVIGIDILPVKPLHLSNVKTIVGDIREISVAHLLAEHAMKHFDAVACDIAPNLTGIRDVDNKNVEDLYLAAHRIIEDALRKGGNAILKSFFSEAFRDITVNTKQIFNKVTPFKPSASRSASSEIYLVAMGKK